MVEGGSVPHHDKESQGFTFRILRVQARGQDAVAICLLPAACLLESVLGVRVEHNGNSELSSVADLGGEAMMQHKKFPLQSCLEVLAAQSPRFRKQCYVNFVCVQHTFD